MLTAAGGVFLFSKTVMVLSVENLDHPISFHHKVAPSEQVTLSYTNSIYDAPVEESFEIQDGNIILKTIRTDSPAVMEYYGFEKTLPVLTLNKTIGPALWIQASMRQDQGIRVGREALDLRLIAEPGDRLQVSVHQVSLARFFWWKSFRSKEQANRGH